MGYHPFSRPQVLIANGTALSAAVLIAAGDLVAIEMPAAWTAANLTFQTSSDGVTFQNLFNESGVEVNVTAAAAENLAIGEGTTARIENFAGAVYLKVRSGTNAVPVNQGADRTLTLVIRRLSRRL